MVPLGAPMKILIVDDEPTNLVVLTALLVKEGHAIIAATNGQEAIEKFKMERPDMVLMDVLMPDMDGYEATASIKELCHDDFVPVIFLTALSDEQSLIKGLDAGGDDFLAKPYSRATLRAKIRAMQRIRSLNIALREQRDELAHYHRKTQEELELAKHVFAAITRNSYHDVSCFQSWSEAQSHFSGDLILSARTPTGDVNLLIGDCTGHGLSAAVGAIPISDIFYAMSKKGFSIGEIIQEMNRKLADLMPKDMFFAACFASVSADGCSLSIWNAGMPDVLVFDRECKTAQRIGSAHLPLGIQKYDWRDMGMQIVDISSNTTVLFYTDGLVEATNEAGEPFGLARLEQALCAEPDRERTADAVTQALRQFTAGARRRDDVSLLAVGGKEWCATSGFSYVHGEHTTRMPAAWRMEATFSAQSLRNFELPPIVSNFVMDVQAPEGHADRICTVVTELYSNALEHGLLGLASAMKDGPHGFARYYHLRESRLADIKDGSIRISLVHRPLGEGGELEIVVADSGPGFDTRPLFTDLAGNSQLSGRGIGVVRALCSELEYLGNGNTVRAVYHWSNTAQPRY